MKNGVLSNRSKRHVLAFGGILLGVLLVSACHVLGDGISPVGTVPAVPRKQLATTMVGPHIGNPHWVRTVLHVDVEMYNPLNAMDFFVGQQRGDGSWISQNPLFEYVVLGYAYLARDERGYASLRLTPALRHILENNSTYLWPLSLRGIKVLVEVRSGRFADYEAGDGLGLGTLDMPAVNRFLDQLGMLVERFGLDGLEFNDIGGGYRSLPPHTEFLTRFESSERMYPESMFQDAYGIRLEQDAVNEILWQEGGQNLTDMLIYVNEHLKVRRHLAADFGGVHNDGRIVETIRTVLVRSVNHGNRMPTMVRPAFTPDAYTGATPYIVQNVEAIIVDANNELDGTAPNFPFRMMWNAAAQRYEPQLLEAFAPFVVDLSLYDRMTVVQARALAGQFAGTFQIPNRFGTLYFSNLPTLGEDPNIAAFLSAFTGPVFAGDTHIHDGGGNRPRPTW